MLTSSIRILGNRVIHKGDYRVIYRVIYTIRDKELMVLVVKIGDRKETFSESSNLSSQIND